MHLNQELQKLAEKYYRLMNLEEPSDSELSQLEEILELATVDEELNDLLIKIDEKIALEAGLISNELASKSWVTTLVSSIADEHFYSQIKRLINVTFLCVIPIGVLLLLKQCHSIQLKLVYHTSLNYYKAPAPIEKREAKRERVLSKREKEQREYECKQREFEKEQIDSQRWQLYFEAKQKQAEAKNLFKQAQEYLLKAQQYRNKYEKSLSLSKQCRIKAEKSSSMTE